MKTATGDQIEINVKHKTMIERKELKAEKGYISQIVSVRVFYRFGTKQYLLRHHAIFPQKQHSNILEIYNLILVVSNASRDHRHDI